MRRIRRIRTVMLAVALAAAALAALLPGAAGGAGTSTRYLVVLAGEQTTDGFQAAGDVGTVKTLVALAGGTVTNDMTRQIGVLVVESPSAAFDEALRGSPLIAEVGEDWSWQGLPSADQFTVLGPEGVPDGGPEETSDPLETLQWDMQMIRTPAAHATQTGGRSVEVGILDSGIDGSHPDFFVDSRGSNVDCVRGRDSVATLGGGTGAGTPAPCVDNQFHGTHVAGTVAAQANGVGVVGVAPNVTLLPVKVCDTAGYCYASAVVDGITYSGDQQFEVINMSFFVDDENFLGSTEFKCSSDPVQRSFRRAVERAIQYARSRGVTPVAALGNSDQDLAHPVDENGEPISNECEVVPAETQGVVGTMALGRLSQKASYSNYGTGPTDVAAPGGTGTGNCNNAILSTLPGASYGCISGTSMASPHTAGVAALIISQFGRVGSDGDVKMEPTKVENYLQSTTIDIGLPGYDECFGNGRIDALRAVTHDTSRAYDSTAPYCPEYAE